MPRYTEETFGSGDQSWVGSSHGTYNCQTVTIDHSAFVEATHYPDGYLPSGTQLNVADRRVVVPFTGADGEKLAFLYTDQSMKVAADFAAPVFEHGFIVIANLPAPLAFVAPATEFDQAASPQFVFRSGEVA